MKVNELIDILSKVKKDENVYFIVDEDIFQYDIACIGTLSNTRKPEHKTLYLINESYQDIEYLAEYLWEEHGIDLDYIDTQDQFEKILEELKIETLTGLFITVIPN
jgi:uncharacterized protein with von Willebrand factor type A (vWA) domain